QPVHRGRSTHGGRRRARRPAPPHRRDSRRGGATDRAASNRRLTRYPSPWVYGTLPREGRSTGRGLSMATVQPVPTPTHLWVVGILSLLWNGFGAYDYTMSHVGGLAYFETMGLDAEAL